jgi:peptidoglycan/xylan/chitin deacetylase (PgdA/CDA1 family)
LRAEETVGVVGDHSWSHAHLLQLPRWLGWLELARTQYAVSQELGHAPTLFRAPYEEHDPTLDATVASFGLVLIGASASYVILERTLIRAEGDESRVKRAIGAGAKEWISFALYVAAVPAAFVSPFISIAIYVGVSIVWLVPDRRFEERAR